MIPKKIQALFNFIDYLDSRKTELTETYIPLCNTIMILDKQRSALNPRDNYKDKLQFDVLDKEIKEKCQPLHEYIYIPVTNKLLELGIWSGDGALASIWNNNMSAIWSFKGNFEPEDTDTVIQYKRKYLDFRSETNSNFLGLQLTFSSLDEIFKSLFDFFKDSTDNEFESFETKTIKADSWRDVAEAMAESKGKNVRFSLPANSLFDYQSVKHLQTPQSSVHIQNHYNMGDNIQMRDISNNSGPVLIGKDNSITTSFNQQTELAGKIEELINLIRHDQQVSDHEKQPLITNFDKVREELLEQAPDKPKITKWLTATKGILRNIVFSHEVKEAADWVYKALHSLIN